MSTPPFTTLRHLPADLAIGAWLVYSALLGLGWDYARPRLSRALTAWGARLA